MCTVGVCWLAALSCSDPELPACIQPGCEAGSLVDSDYCPDGECVRLEALSQGCIGSHTEQPCEFCGRPFVRVGGDDAAELFFEQNGLLAAVHRLGAGSARCDAWYGIELAGCNPTGQSVTVPCDGAGP
jgi:hypothetical protein